MMQCIFCVVWRRACRLHLCRDALVECLEIAIQNAFPAGQYGFPIPLIQWGVSIRREGWVHVVEIIPFYLWAVLPSIFSGLIQCLNCSITIAQFGMQIAKLNNYCFQFLQEHAVGSCFFDSWRICKIRSQISVESLKLSPYCPPWEDQGNTMCMIFFQIVCKT